MNNQDIISGTEKAHEIEMATVLVSGLTESQNSYGAIVDLVFDENGKYKAGSRLEWFPKSCCSFEKAEDNSGFKLFYITAPVWLINKKNLWPIQDRK